MTEVIDAHGEPAIRIRLRPVTIKGAATLAMLQATTGLCFGCVIGTFVVILGQHGF